MGVNNNVNPNSYKTAGPFVKALDNYFLVETNPGNSQRNHVSNVLNETTESIFDIQERINFFFSYTSSPRVKKFLDLMEFLSLYSSEKLLEIINTEKFMDTFASVLMEPEFEDNLLNLLRMWYDIYERERSKAHRIFELIENLPNFGLMIPPFYKSKYEGLDRDILSQPTKDEKIDNVNRTMPNSNVGKIEICDREIADQFLVKADAARDRINALLADPDFDEMPLAQREGRLEMLEDDINSVLNKYVLPQQNILDPEMRETIENAINNLRKFQEDLKDKRKPPAAANNQAVYGPMPREASQSHAKSSLREFPNMMELEEFIAYKTMPCRDQMMCKFAPISTKSSHSGIKREINCIYWHGPQDRRRPFTDERGNLLYKCTQCGAREECRTGDHCRMSHNYFETFFHPLNYKKKRCPLVTSCRNGKYCPSYHTPKEKEAWGRFLKEFFNLREEEDNVIVEEELFGNGPSKATQQAYENVRRHLPPNMMIPIEAHSAYSQAMQDYEKTYVEKRQEEVKPEIKDVPSQKPKDKELLSTLVLRKKYVEPGHLTAILHKNPCFYGVPLYGNEVQEDKEKNNVEIKVGKVLENGHVSV